MDEFLKGISLIGRSLALWTCVGHIRAHLQQSVADLTALQQQAMTAMSQGAGQGAAAIDMKNCTQQLEIQRICSLFLTHLLFEGGDRSTSSGSLDSSVLLDVSMAASSSDLTLAPRSLVEPLDCFLLQASSGNSGEGPSQSAVNDFTAVVSQLYEEMTLLLPLCAESVALQQQALVVTKQLRSQLEMRQIDAGGETRVCIIII
jgi:hypothetical protein